MFRLSRIIEDGRNKCDAITTYFQIIMFYGNIGTIDLRIKLVD